MTRCLVSACGILLAAIAGCTTKPAELNPESNPYLEQGRIQFEDHTTDAIVDVVKVDTERLNGGLLKLAVTMRNKTQNNLFVEIRTTFLDDKKHVVDQTNWEPVELNARTVSEYTCTSTTSKAADYQIIIRKPAKTSLDKF